MHIRRAVIALIIGLTSWMEVARIIRAQIQHIKEQDFVQAAFARVAANSPTRNELRASPAASG